MMNQAGKPHQPHQRRLQNEYVTIIHEIVRSAFCFLLEMLEPHCVILSLHDIRITLKIKENISLGIITL